MEGTTDSAVGAMAKISLPDSVQKLMEGTADISVCAMAKITSPNSASELMGS